MIPDYFELYELFPTSMCKEDKKLWLLIDERLLWTLDRLREGFGPIVMNDYHWGGHNQFRGWRPVDCEVGAKFSQHKAGRAADCVFKKTDPQRVMEIIMGNQQADDFKFIRAIKLYGWGLHVSVRGMDKQPITII